MKRKASRTGLKKETKGGGKVRGGKAETPAAPKRAAKRSGRARDLMTVEVATCGPNDSMAAAARLMWDHDCGVVPVVEADGRLAGIITDRDICMAAFTRDERLSLLPVRAAMTLGPATCRDTDSRTAVHAAMRERRVRRLPVVDADNRLVGILSLNDLVRDAVSGRGPRGSNLITTLAEIGRR